MDYINEALNKTKEVFGVVKQKTSDAIDIGVQKYDIAVLERDLSKLYNKLGKSAYAVFCDSENTPDELKREIEAITLKQKQILKAKAELNTTRNKRICAACGAAIDSDSTFCNFCGEKVTFTE